MSILMARRGTVFMEGKFRSAFLNLNWTSMESGALMKAKNLKLVGLGWEL